MKVSEILKVKGNILYTVTPDTSMLNAVNAMAEKDIGSLVVMEFGDLVGMLTFREVMKTLYKYNGSLGADTVRKQMKYAGSCWNGMRVRSRWWTRRHCSA
jgi:CBS domain-containing protein